MSRRMLAPVAVVGVLAAALGLPAEAAPPPITKTYTVTLLPFPNASWGSACQEKSSIPSDHHEEFAAPAPGTLKVVMSDFQGDFDGAIVDPKGKYLAASDNAAATPNTSPGIKETITYKVKKAQPLVIRVCNFLASPSAKVTYTFTFAK
ncbi:MAG TPA: hypothetical protein VNA12_03860 [Mycobacteriales bacterium]|nr:hypothetical protein [Mycobacteriales bacterium]